MVEGVIVQGTTPDFIFDLPLSLDLIKGIRASLSQKGKTIITKNKSQCDFDLEKGIFSIFLTQQETYLLDARKGQVELRVRFYTEGEKVIVSDPIYFRVENIADKTLLMDQNNPGTGEI